MQLSQHYGTRGCQEHHQLKVEDLKFVRDISGNLVSVEWVEGPTKTRPGGLTKADRRLPQRMFRQGGERCPVMFLNLMISKRPDVLKDCGPLYLRPLDTPRQDTWYSLQPVGVRTIDTYMRKITSLAGLNSTNKKFTNHSMRKTTVRKLQKAGISNDKIAAITGHRNEQSLRDYATVDLEDHKAIGAVLCNSDPFQNFTNSQSKAPPLFNTMSSYCSSRPAESHYNFTQCTVYFGSNTTCTQVNQDGLQSSRKKSRCIIESDSE